MKMTKAAAGLELMTYGFLVNAVTHCAMLIGYNFEKGKTIMK